MKQLGTVFQFELMVYLKRKSFIVLTLILVLLVAATLSWPRISGLLGFGGGEESGEESGAKEIQTVALAAEGTDVATAAKHYTGAMQDMNLRFTPVPGGLDELKTLVESGEVDSGVLLTGPLSYTRVVRNTSLYDVFDEAFAENMRLRYQVDTLEDFGLPHEVVGELMTAAPTAETITVAAGKDQAQNFLYTYILVFLLYFAILMYGQFVASSVATEKSTRAMELLVTSAKPNSLIFGKVLGAGCAGLLQMVLLLGAAFLFYHLNQAYYQDNFLVQSLFNIPLPMLGYTLVFFILGFFLYAFLYAGLASLVSRMEDLATAIMPVTYLFIIAFIVVMFSMSSGNVDNIAILICSYFPLTSSMAMFTRIAMGDVAFWEIAISIVLLFASTIAAGVLSARIYRLGVLLYGTPPKPREIVRMLKAEHRNNRA